MEDDYANQLLKSDCYPSRSLELPELSKIPASVSCSQVLISRNAPSQLHSCGKELLGLPSTNLSRQNSQNPTIWLVLLGPGYWVLWVLDFGGIGSWDSWGPGPTKEISTLRR